MNPKNVYAGGLIFLVLGALLVMVFSSKSLRIDNSVTDTPWLPHEMSTTTPSLTTYPGQGTGWWTKMPTGIIAYRSDTPTITQTVTKTQWWPTQKPTKTKTPTPYTHTPTLTSTPSTTPTWE